MSLIGKMQDLLPSQADKNCTCTFGINLWRASDYIIEQFKQEKILSTMDKKKKEYTVQ